MSYLRHLAVMRSQHLRVSFSEDLDALCLPQSILESTSIALQAPVHRHLRDAASLEEGIPASRADKADKINGQSILQQ